MIKRVGSAAALRGWAGPAGCAATTWRSTGAGDGLVTTPNCTGVIVGHMNSAVSGGIGDAVICGMSASIAATASVGERICAAAVSVWVALGISAACAAALMVMGTAAVCASALI